MKSTLEILQAAKAAKASLSLLTTEKKNAALAAMASALIEATDDILAANAQDVEASREKLGEVMVDRLTLTPARIEGMAQGMCALIDLPDPVGRVIDSHVRADGLRIEKIGVPMGVVAIIYESRPNVTSDAAALSLKSGNVCVLRGGKEAYRSAHAIVTAMKTGLRSVGLDENLIQLIEDTTRESATALMEAVGYVDLLIPRGGAGLIRTCVERAKVPVIQTGTGICHVYVDASADADMALTVLENAKTSRPSVCNACEVCLVHKDIAAGFLPLLDERLATMRAESGKPTVTFRCDEASLSLIPHGTAAGEDDFDTEFLDYILAVRVVRSVDEAIAHIAAHSTGHSEAILSRDEGAIARFVGAVDSAAVYVNASTRFTDGGEFGLGCEMGISTQKLHARGPMGLCELTTYKYVIRGEGHVR
ncbi:MAG: glutamate-5-semialdehyde dehydrogenase [Ruminococcaceae bacterium]|nr:glutamate-5-semialdehyde dehydrogenase [Oscillospiraceae bacterium]